MFNAGTVSIELALSDDELRKALKSVQAELVKVPGVAKKTGKDLSTGLAEGAKGAKTTVTAVEGISKETTATAAAGAKAAGQLSSSFKTAGTTIKNDVKTTFTGVNAETTGAATTAGTAANKFTQAFKTTGSGIKAGLNGAFDGVPGDASKAMNGATGTVSSAGNDMADTLTDAGAEGGRGFADKAKSAINAGSVAVVAAAVAIGASIVSSFNDAIEQGNAKAKLNAMFMDTPEQGQQAGKLAATLYTNAFGETFEESAQIAGIVQSTFKDVTAQGEKAAADFASNFMSVTQTYEQDAEELSAAIGSAVSTGLVKNSQEGLDLFAAAYAKMPATMRGELPALIEEYGKDFAQMGASGEQAFGVMVEASKSGRFAMDKSGDAIKEFALLAASGSEDIRNQYSAMGLDWREVTTGLETGGTKGQEAFKKITDALAKIKDPIQRNATAIQLFGSPLEDLGKQNLGQLVNGLTTSDNAIKGATGAAGRLNQKLNDTPTAKFESLKRTVAQFGTDVITNNVLPAINKGADAAGKLMSAFQSGNVDESTTGLERYASVAGAGLRDAWEKSKPVLEGVGTAVTKVANGISATVRFMQENGPAIAIFAGYIGILTTAAKVNAVMTGVTAAGGIIKYIASTNLVGGAMRVAAAAQWLFNAAMLANPVGIVLLALTALGVAFAILWNKSETFRNIVTGAWESIKTAAFAVASWFTDTLMPGIQNALNSIGGFFTGLWNNHVTPAWAGIKNTAKAVGDWFTVDLPRAYSLALSAIGGYFTGLWNNHVTPAFDGVKRTAKAVGDWFAVDLVNGFWSTMRGIGSVFTWLYEKGVKPPFDLVGAYFKTWWDAAQGVFAAAKQFISGDFAGGFETLKNTATGALENLQNLAKKPILFVVNTIFGGLANGVNSVLGFLFNGGGPRVPVPNLSFATGGVLPGYSPGTDNMHYYSPEHGSLSLSGGEAIMRPEVTAAMGADWVHGMNAAARTGGTSAVAAYANGGHQHYATGGVVPMSSSQKARAVGDWYDPLKGAADWTGNAIKTGAQWTGDKVVQGAKATWAGAEWLGNKAVEAGSALYGAAADIGEAIANPTAVFTKLVQRLGTGGSTGAMLDIVTGLPPKAMDGVKSLITGKANAQVAAKQSAAAAGDPGAVEGMPAAPGGSRKLNGWSQIVAAAKRAFPDVSVTSTVRGVNSGLPNASTSRHALGRAVDLAYGMNFSGLAKMVQVFKYFDANFAPDELLHSPMGGRQINRGGRRGDTSGQLRAMHYNHVHVAFRDGGVLDKHGLLAGQKATLYDRGGLVQPGLNLVANATGKPERVLNAKHTEQLDTLLGGELFDMQKFAQVMLSVMRSAPQQVTVEVNNPLGRTAIESIDQAADRLRNGGHLV